MVLIDNEKDNINIYLDCVSNVVWDNSTENTLKAMYLKKVGEIYFLHLQTTDNEFFKSVKNQTPLNMGMRIDAQEAEKLINLGVQLEN